MGLKIRRSEKTGALGERGATLESPVSLRVVLGRSGCNLEFHVKQPVCGTVS